MIFFDVIYYDMRSLESQVKSDEKNNKTTYVTIYGLDGASKLVEEYSHTAMTLLDQVCPNASFLKRTLRVSNCKKKIGIIFKPNDAKGGRLWYLIKYRGRMTSKN